MRVLPDIRHCREKGCEYYNTRDKLAREEFKAIAKRVKEIISED